VPGQVTHVSGSVQSLAFHSYDSQFRATGIRIAELAGIRYHPDDPARSDLDLERRKIRIRGKGGRDRTVRIDHEAARRLDRCHRARSRHEQAHRLTIWPGTGGRGPLTGNGICQMVRRRGQQAGVQALPHRFRHHFSHTWLDRGGVEGDLLDLPADALPLRRQRPRRPRLPVHHAYTQAGWADRRH
jgi:integrase/recombinase XerD